tara:strand:+ start:318 stop:656 length:339 start_codon:yes stop_codon:yes gene_type:complete
MAKFTLTNARGNDTIPPNNPNEFAISTLYASKCPPVVYQNVDTVAYFDNVSDEGGKQRDNPIVGEIVYADAALTTLYVTSFPTLTQEVDYNINKGDFITIGPGSVIINTSCK